MSGPGLVNLYGAICEIEGKAPLGASAADVTALGKAGDPQAAVALDRFCGIFGAAAGDLAL